MHEQFVICGLDICDHGDRLDSLEQNLVSRVNQCALVGQDPTALVHLGFLGLELVFKQLFWTLFEQHVVWFRENALFKDILKPSVRANLVKVEVGRLVLGTKRDLVNCGNALISYGYLRQCCRYRYNENSESDR